MAEMQEELMRGVVRNISRLIILWILNREQSTGYEILKEMRRITNQDFHPGVVYPLIHELEQGEYIVGNQVQKGRRQMKYYYITEKGRDFLIHLRSLFELPIGSVLQELLSEKGR